MSSTSSPSAFPTEADGVFTNAKGEPFHYTIFNPSNTRAPPTNTDGSVPVLLCVHGAGMSGDCFFQMARELQRHGDGTSESQAFPTVSPPSASGGKGMPPMSESSSLAMVAIAASRGDDIDMHIVTYDLRCHGQSTSAGGEKHLEMAVLMEDFLNFYDFAKEQLFPNSHFFIMGHSLGGAIVARALHSSKTSQQRLAGVIMVEIVEGTAQMSLAHMSDYLKKRPNYFPSVDDAVAWFLHFGGMQNPRGAAISVPPLLRQNPETRMWHWRTDLHKMEAVWGGWFTGVDEAFVALLCAKMLCTANAERLDKALTVAQMQGKFQFEVIGNGCGHYVMDDATATLVAKVRRFVKRHEVLAQKLQQLNRRIPIDYSSPSVTAKPA